MLRRVSGLVRDGGCGVRWQHCTRAEGGFKGGMGVRWQHCTSAEGGFQVDGCCGLRWQHCTSAEGVFKGGMGVVGRGGSTAQVLRGVFRWMGVVG